MIGTVNQGDVSGIAPGAAEAMTPEQMVPVDKLFADSRKHIDDFNFGARTAAVFDDMLNRSVPFYGETQRMIGELAADFAEPNSCVYDLGCSTCNSFMAIGHFLPRDIPVKFIGIDSSREMLDKAQEKLKADAFPWEFELQHADLDRGVNVRNASVVLLVLTLQFVRPLYRDALLASICRGMNENGCLILVEKILGESSTYNRLFIKHYYEMKKRNGYSELEIAQKREALENVLVPYRPKENEQLLLRSGFKEVDVFFKWYNFSGMIARK